MEKSLLHPKKTIKRHTFIIIAALLLTSLASLLCDCQTKARQQAADKPVSARIDFSLGWSFMKCPAEWPVEFSEENKTMEPVKQGKKIPMKDQII